MRIATRSLPPVTLLLAAIAGCATSAPRCLVDDESRLVGVWEYAGGSDPSMRSTSAEKLGRPTEVEFLVDGRFFARFGQLAEGESALRQTPAGDVEGRWSAGRYCAHSLFMPRTHISLTPNVPNATDVVIRGDRLIALGADSGMTDAEYRRSARASDDAPNDYVYRSPTGYLCEAYPQTSNADSKQFGNRSTHD